MDWVRTRLRNIRYKHGANRRDLNKDLIELEEDIERALNAFRREPSKGDE